MQRNIFFISSSIVPSTSANSVNVMKISEALANQGHKVELFVLNNPNSEFKNSEQVNLFNYYSVKPCFSIRKIHKSKLYNLYMPIIAKREKADLVYTRHPLIAYLTSRLGIETIFHGHGLYYRKYYKILLRYLPNSRYLKKIAVASNGLKNVYEKEYMISNTKLEMISNGVDFKRFNIKISKLEARKLLGFKSSERILCYSGHLYKGRGMETIIKMSKTLKKHSFIIVGGTNQDIVKWKKFATDNVKFLGHVLNSKVPLYLLSADYLLMPYQNKVAVDGGGINTGEIIRPLKMFEYMAANRPIITSDLKGLREVLNESNSLLANPEDSNDWVEKVHLLDSDPILASKLADNARRDVMKYSCDEIAKQILC